MYLSNQERETIILFNEAEPDAQVYTCNGRIRRKLEELAEKGIEGVSFVKADDYSVTYTVPKKLVKISVPRQVSKEQREQLLQNLNSVNQKNKG